MGLRGIHRLPSIPLNNYVHGNMVVIEAISNYTWVISSDVGGAIDAVVRALSATHQVRRV